MGCYPTGAGLMPFGWDTVDRLVLPRMNLPKVQQDQVAYKWPLVTHAKFSLGHEFRKLKLQAAWPIKECLGAVAIPRQHPESSSQRIPA